MIELIIFDWDDVITLGAKEGYFACYHAALLEVGVVLSPAEEKKRILARWGQPFREELNELLKEHAELVGKAVEVFEKTYWGDTFINSLRVQDGVIELLPRLREKYALAVATGNHLKMLGKIIQRFEIPEVFAQIVTSHEIDPNKTKPHPYMLQKIMETQQVSPAETIFVGDAQPDVEMAQNASVEPVVVLTGHLTSEAAERLGAKYIIEDVTKIEEALS